MPTPKIIKKKALRPRCQYLDQDGKQCRGRTLFQIEFHGDPELKTGMNDLSWVKVYICPEHCLGTVYASALLKGRSNKKK